MYLLQVLRCIYNKTTTKQQQKMALVICHILTTVNSFTCYLLKTLPRASGHFVCQVCQLVKAKHQQREGEKKKPQRRLCLILEIWQIPQWDSPTPRHRER